MQLFLIAFQQPIPFGISAAVVILMIGIMLRAAMVAEGGSTWVKRITNPNAKFLFAFLFIERKAEDPVLHLRILGSRQALLASALAAG